MWHYHKPPVAWCQPPCLGRQSFQSSFICYMPHHAGTLHQCVVGLACAFSLSFPPNACHFELNSPGQTGKAIPASRNHQECASFISLPFLFLPRYLASCLSVWPARGMLVPFYQRIQQLPSLHFRGVGGDGTVSPQRCSGIFFILSLNPFCT